MYKKEMDTYLRSMISIKSFRLGNFLVAGFGKVSSNFGQSWILSLFWIISIIFFKTLFSSDFYSLSYLLSGSVNL